MSLLDQSVKAILMYLACTIKLIFQKDWEKKKIKRKTVPLIKQFKQKNEKKGELNIRRV